MNQLRGLKSRSFAVVGDLILATLIGAISRGGTASSIAAGNPSHVTFSGIVGGASSRDRRVATPIINCVGQQ